MNSLKKALCSSLALVSTLLFANTIMDGTKADAWPKDVTLAADGVLESKNPRARIISQKSLDVDTKKIYKISGDFRIEGTCSEKKIRLYFGFAPCTAKNKPLATPTVFILPYPLATVAKPVAKDATEIVLKGAEGWTFPTKNLRIAFNAKEDNSDLPNSKISPACKPNPSKNADGTITVALTAPIKYDVPEGTVVRAHMDGNTYIYTGCNAKYLSNTWLSFSGTITGTGNCNLPQNWWIHTAKAKVIFFVQGSIPKDCKLQFRNIKVEEVTKP